MSFGSVSANFTDCVALSNPPPLCGRGASSRKPIPSLGFIPYAWRDCSVSAFEGCEQRFPHVFLGIENESSDVFKMEIRIFTRLQIPVYKFLEHLKVFYDRVKTKKLKFPVFHQYCIKTYIALCNLDDRIFHKQR